MTNKDEMRFVSASTFSLEALADIFTQSFEGYFYPGVTTAQSLSGRVRFEQLDLAASVVMLVGDTPAGIALLGLRDDRAWCGGFGVTAPFRGRGLAHELARAMVEHARTAGAARLSLEVLTRNDKAVKAYRGAGLQIQRELHIFEWVAEHSAKEITKVTEIQAVEPRVLLAQFERLHAVPAAWQRDLPALLVKRDLQSVALMRDGAPAAYALYAVADETTRIQDFAAIHVDDAVAILHALQCRAARIIDINEPSNSPVLAAFAQTGFKETDQQHEMELVL